MEHGETTGRSKKIKSQLFEKIRRTDQTLARVRKKGEKMKITKNIYERGNIVTDLKGI